MSDNRKYYYLKLKENYFDDDSIVLLESMQDGVLYSNILLKLYLKSLKHGGRLQLDEDIPYTAQMIATITRQQIGTVERALQIFLKLGLVEVLDSGTFYMSNIELLIGQSSTEAERKRAARLQNKALSAPRTNGGHLSDIRPPEIEIELEKEIAEYIKESEAYLDQQEIKKLAVDLDNFSYEYDTYEYKDSVENREEQVEKITEDILNKDTAGLKDWLTEVSEESDIDSDVVTARSLLSRLENAETFSAFTRKPEQEQPEATITFYVAECMEFPVMGEYHENLTLEEALRIYETIPADRMNGIKGVGFELHDGSDYDGPYDFMRLGKVDREDVDMIQHYKESPLVQKAMDDVEKYFAQKQELTKIEEKPIQKENVPQPKSRKESVLQALRERQAKIKEQEQNTSKEKSKTHKKGDVTL